MNILRGALIAFALVLVSGCTQEPRGPESQYKSWREFRDSVAVFLNDELEVPNNMRIVPASVAYPIGTVLRRDSMSALSSRCAFHGQAPPPLPGPIFPTVTTLRGLGGSLDAGTFLGQSIKELQALNVAYNQTALLNASVKEVTIQQIAENEILSVVKGDECFSDIEARDISVIRGHIAARFQVSSGSAIDSNLNVEVYQTELATLRYINGDRFEVEQNAPSTQFLILADGRPSTMLAFRAEEVVFAGAEEQFPERFAYRGCEEVPSIAFGSAADSERSIASPKSVYEFSSCEDMQRFMEAHCYENDSAEDLEKCRELFPDLFR